MKTCFACYEKAKVSDLVFTHYAPEAQNVYLPDPPYGNGKCQKTGVTGVLLEHFACKTTVPAFFPFLVGSIDASDTWPCSPQGPVNPLLKDAAPGLLKWAFYDHEDLGRVLFPLVED